jgi:hypothetical protein
MIPPDQSHEGEISHPRVILSLPELPERERTGRGYIIWASDRPDCTDLSIIIKDGYPVFWRDPVTRKLDYTKIAMKYRMEIEQKHISDQEQQVLADCLQGLERENRIYIQWEIVNIVPRGTRYAKIIALDSMLPPQQQSTQQDIRMVMRGGKRR